MTNTPKNRDEVVEIGIAAVQAAAVAFSGCEISRVMSRELVSGLLTALEAAGLRIVPAGATEEMNEAFWGSEGSPSDDPWEIMLDASPYNPQRGGT